eukprot:15430341-Alexandrium_andersonii.AAC.1
MEPRQLHEARRHRSTPGGGDQLQAHTGTLYPEFQDRHSSHPFSAPNLSGASSPLLPPASRGASSPGLACPGAPSGRNHGTPREAALCCRTLRAARAGMLPTTL